MKAKTENENKRNKKNTKQLFQCNFVSYLFLKIENILQNTDYKTPKIGTIKFARFQDVKTKALNKRLSNICIPPVHHQHPRVQDGFSEGQCKSSE